MTEAMKPSHTLPDSKPQTLEGDSPAFQNMYSKIERVAGCGASVLLLGESGTGKELAAEAIHAMSGRSDKPLVTLECAGLTDTLFESELFGHVKGAFTGAATTKKGLVEQADGGTLFLDEIGDVPLSMQVKLLRLLETGTFRKVGSAKVQQANFRLICATHLDIHKLIQNGQFRQDLFYRINVFPIRIPALRERKEDITKIATALVGRMKTKRPMHITESAVQRLAQYHFPGNIRELRNILARAVVLSKTNIIDEPLIIEAFAIDTEPSNASTTTTALQSLQQPPATTEQWTDLKTAEQDYLQRMYYAFNEDKERTAQVAGISVRSLYRKLML